MRISKDALTASCLFSSEEHPTRAPLYLINSIRSPSDVRVAEVFAIVRDVEKWWWMQQRGNYMHAHVIINLRVCSPPGIVPGAEKSEKKLKVQDSAKTKAKNVVIPPKKVLPQLKWTPVPRVTSKVQVEERIFIREFALRFGHVMEPIISKSSLEELEFIAGKTKSDDNDEMLAWVSEPCFKGLVLGLLGLLAKDHESNVAKVSNFDNFDHTILSMSRRLK